MFRCGSIGGACRFVDAPAALGYAPLHLAAGHGHGRAVEALLYGGANPRVRCLGRMFSTYLMPQRFKPAATPLHVAAVRGDLSICASLLQYQVASSSRDAVRHVLIWCGELGPAEFYLTIRASCTHKPRMSRAVPHGQHASALLACCAAWHTGNMSDHHVRSWVRSLGWKICGSCETCVEIGL